MQNCLFKETKESSKIFLLLLIKTISQQCVKKWVPELDKVPSKFIHKPWEMELKYQQAIKTIIGKEYPEPIVIHEKARASALEAFQSLKKK